jgi:hypothetical protein
MLANLRSRSRYAMRFVALVGGHGTANPAKASECNQLPVLFDGKNTPAAAIASGVSEGYVGKCAP